jgi:hypothetical protein
MSDSVTDVQRRTVLQMAAGLSAAPLLGETAQAATVEPQRTGKAGDFDFLNGNWSILNQRLKDGAWDQFASEASVFGILGGIASVEELRIPARGFSGMGLRLLDIERSLWADFWVNSRSGVLTPPPSWGSFVDGVGSWISDDLDGDKPIRVRGIWDQITAGSCRWYQSVSRDGGMTWQDNWIMLWTRA